MSAFPKRSRPWYRYMPLVSVVSLFWWITGLGLWIHFTQVAYTKGQDFMDIMQLNITSGVGNQIDRVISSMISTSIVFALFAVLIHALGIYRGQIELDQDTEGELDEASCMAVSWGNIAIQIAWWVIVLWMLVLVVGFGAFAAFIYTAKSAVLNAVVMQAATILAGGTVPPMLPGYCPNVCYSVVSAGLFLWSGTTSQGLQLCVCDTATLQAALGAIDAANSATPGMLVGLLLMLAYGVVLLAYMVTMFSNTTGEQALSTRLAEQGWAPSAPLKSSAATSRR